MRVSLLAAAALLPAYASATFSISSPSGSEFWVFNRSNAVNWTSTAGDPTEFNIDIINTNSSILNGAFSIAPSVANSLSFVISNVTLVPGDGYIMQFVNVSDPTQVFVNSSAFTVMPNGTAPAPPVTGSSSASGNGSSGSATSGSGSSTASGSSASPSATNGASSLLNTKSVVVAAGVMALSALAM
ncbi:hypothetical protein BDP27DRAFT_1319067 [Rhodocollybia butyracea]|uniref:Yeast cell wall synthesis Kre9/Knh1-like N-terminal domain-containing protein n=1 Tax=Rhodocollybia butyracea TaxID=206335 RepID=A0A9P5Q1A4_9AGAR|nr:hypothetical protein BDP27DRAFT_1319067 [Rhodocollybia butyracea]